jgi:hypothetical protein
MDHDGGLDARAWMRHATTEVVAMVRHALTQEPTPLVGDSANAYRWGWGHSGHVAAIGDPISLLIPTAPKQAIDAKAVRHTVRLRMG